MEDNEQIRQNIADLLTGFGYEIGTARDGEEAIRLYGEALESGEPFQAAVMDLIIAGGMGAKECIKELRGMDPGVKAIVTSGYADGLDMLKIREMGFAGFIPKPFYIEELHRTLQNIITGRSDTGDE